MRHIAVAALFLLALVAPVSASPPYVLDAYCATWAAEINNPRNSYRMRQLGCNDDVARGEYQATQGICARLARQGARTGLRGHKVVVYVRGEMNRCYWDPAQRAYGMKSTTW